jgi:anti-sigma factor RsiW
VATRPTDLELMMLADGELPAERAREVQAAIAADPLLKARLDGVGALGDGLRDHLARETERAEADLPEFADLWAGIERGIQGEAPVAAPEAPVVPARRPRATPAADAGAWAAIRGWFEGARGHVLTGLVSAGAVAGLMLWLRPLRIVEPAAPTRVDGPPVVATMVAGTPCGDATAAPAPPEVESFEVFEGSGAVFTLPGDGEDDSAATVIWISKDQDTVEGPI